MSLAKVLDVSKLQGKAGSVDVATIEGKTLMIYFSAHWCPPCRQFTPVLAKFYTELKAKRDDFELVFASSDRDQKSFDEYFHEHPWLALPFEDRKAKDKLSKKFKVQGIPTLVVVDKNGETVTTSARNNVMQDPKGERFPWIPKKANEILASMKITDKSGKTLTADDLNKFEAIALYFSAHWCPPCRRFTPSLIGTYNKLKAAGRNIEFIFVSSDNSEDEYKEYYGEMPWATAGFECPQKDELDELFKVEGIPTLVTLGPNGKVINVGARGAASEDPDGKEFPWAPKPRGAFSDFGPSDDVIEALNSEICFILDENDSKDFEAARTTFETVAKATFDAAADKESCPHFYICGKSGKDLLSRVYQVIGATPTPGSTNLVAINLPNSKANASHQGAFSAQQLTDFCKKFTSEQE